MPLCEGRVEMARKYDSLFMSHIRDEMKFWRGACFINIGPLVLWIRVIYTDL